MGNKKLRIAGCAIVWALAIAVIIMMFCFSGQSGEESSGLSIRIAEWLMDHFSFIRMEFELFEHLVRKTAHFCMFAAEGFMLYLAVRFTLRSRKAALIGTAGVCAAAAVFNELHQLFSAERSCQVSDMLLDFSGSLAGMLAAMLLFKLARRLKRG